MDLGPLVSLFGDQLYFGNTMTQYVFFFVTVILFVIIAKIIYYVLKNQVSKITAKTKNNIDDMIIKLIQKPLIGALFVAGLLTGLQFLTLSQETSATISNIIGILITLIIMWVIIKVIDVLIKEGLGKLSEKTDSKLDDQLVPLLSKLAKFTVIALFLVIILDNFGYDVTALIAGLGVGGLALAFAAQATIADAFGGFSIITAKPFVVGDAVSVDGTVGKVEEVGVRFTRIRNWDGRLVTIPNSKLASSVIENITSEPTRKVTLNLGLTYDTNTKQMQKAMDICRDIIESHKGCEKKPSITFSEFKDFSLNILVMYYIKEKSSWRDIIGEINMEILKEFEKAKLNFAFPTRTVHVKK